MVPTRQKVKANPFTFFKVNFSEKFTSNEGQTKLK